MKEALFGFVLMGSIICSDSFQINHNKAAPQLSPSMASRPSPSIITEKQPSSRTRSRLYSEINNNGDYEANQKNFPKEIDSLSRRQLLLSMLVSTGASSSIFSNPAIASTQSNSIIKEDQVQSIANSLRSDGNDKLIIPPMDKRIYETMTLDNGLRVILCSDPSSNTAAAAMDVHVGAASDPDSVPGLAHFCEVSSGLFFSMPTIAKSVEVYTCTHNQLYI